MKTFFVAAMSIIAGVVVGAAAVWVSFAQVIAGRGQGFLPPTNPPVYVIGEIDVLDSEPYLKGYVPGASKAVVDGGGKYVVRGGKSVSFYGEPPKLIAVMVFENMEKAQAAFGSAAYKEAKAVGDKYAKFRVYAVEGLPR